jgi:hypothetical protein
MIGVTVLLALMAGCATTTTTSTQDKASMLVAAGFKTITPKTAAQQQKLQQLQTGQVATIQKNGRSNGVGCMGWLGSWLGTNGLWRRGRTARWRWDLRQLAAPGFSVLAVLSA